MACSELELSQQSLKCVNVNTGENCIDKVEVYSNSGQSAITRLSDLRPGQIYNVTIAARNLINQELVTKHTLISMGESTT